MTAASPARCRRALRGGLGWMLVAGFLGGCASPPPASELTLTAAGRLSVRVEAGAARPSQSVSAAFEWRGDGTRGELTLLSPLGTQLALARWSPGQARLITPDGETRFDTLDELAERALGERVPLVAWPDWLAGRPWPGAPSVPATPSGTAAGVGTAAVSGASAAPGTSGAPGATLSSAASRPSFEQLGWVVDLSRHAEGRIDARRSLPPVVTVRIVLDNDGRAAGSAGSAGSAGARP